MGRNIKGHFSITGEVEIDLYATEQEVPETDEAHRSVLVRYIDKKLKKDGIKAFDLQIAFKVKDIESVFVETEEDPF